MKTILIADQVDDILKIQLQNAGFSIKEELNLASEEALKAAIKNVDAVIVRSRTKITAGVIAAATKLKVIARPGVALNNIDVNAATQRGIEVINSPEAPSRSVAELVIGTMFMLARHLGQADSSMKNQQWIKEELMGQVVKGKTLGILGYGRIGREVAGMAHGLGMKVLAYRVKTSDEESKAWNLVDAPEDTVIKESDFLSIHIPLKPENIRYINATKISKMKPTAYLINTSRGEVVDEGALLNALNNGRLAGAALDVYSEEPPKTPLVKELASNPKVVATPHIGAQTGEALLANSEIIAEKLIRLLSS